MRYPIPARWRMLSFWPLLLATLGLSMYMASGPLKTSAAPGGIVSLELAGSLTRAQEVLGSWDNNALRFAHESVLVDFLYLVLYSTTIGIACVWGAERFLSQGWGVGKIGIPLAWGMWLAGLCDAVENVALLRLLGGARVSFWAWLAFGCAVIKFAILVIGLGYVAFGVLVWVLGLVRSRITRR